MRAQYLKVGKKPLWFQYTRKEIYTINKTLEILAYWTLAIRCMLV
jgi:hypothetical protein